MRYNNHQMKAEIIRPNIEDESFSDEQCYILESWNSERDASVSIARARVCPGVSTKLHRIKGIVERYLITHGSGEVAVGDMDPELAGPGDVVIIPKDVPQKITNSGDKDLIFYCICTPRFTADRYEVLD
jgi:mannose-6-phosphate isomerase-like protein (cupin superfamily)